MNEPFTWTKYELHILIMLFSQAFEPAKCRAPKCDLIRRTIYNDLQWSHREIPKPAWPNARSVLFALKLRSCKQDNLRLSEQLNQIIARTFYRWRLSSGGSDEWPSIVLNRTSIRRWSYGEVASRNLPLSKVNSTLWGPFLVCELPPISFDTEMHQKLVTKALTQLIN